ncbi:UDP-N-acetylmuramoyl-L-alanyl-D-glutamate--L-lysine ligase [uncultured Vagococcus sp.]|uniref:UDP-N-acetylmuramoyl-L-alanyl-D-glutamate--L- lysine ligase n=1 Tax=uncultured Vagococcus sp. TaxID=189676 RepID=UPI0028D81559|nr:UDP-N-acetylmuramoyl-L-alanyl-D-glutamate--L-lysine ligase [uncultured Vagococcus sp.]
MLSLETLTQVLVEHDLLKEFIYQDSWYYHAPEPVASLTIGHITYDSRTIQEGSLFFCKGIGFKQSYLEQAILAGAFFYVSETVYDLEHHGLGIIVTDIKKAMAVISMAFYGYPQEELKIIAYTGTKGKTTASYFCKYIMEIATKEKTALFSTMETILDGKNGTKSLLTTPESLDLYRMMRQAVTNGMSHLIMEVSSQAYKTSRVYGLNFDVGVFLNISPDHIGAIEHPDFDDYFYCKRQLLRHSNQLILNRDSDYFEMLRTIGQESTNQIVTYGQAEIDADYCFQPLGGGEFEVRSKNDSLGINGTYGINLLGDFNQGNALSAILATSLVGANREAIHTGLSKARVAGRMEKLVTGKGTSVYVDYAHNYLSLQTLLSFVKLEHPEGQLYVVIGSTGGKGVSRRKDFGRVLSDLADVAVLTTDDPGDENPEMIIADITEALGDHVVRKTILDRKEAISYALNNAKGEDVVVLAGKGNDLYQIIKGERIPYEGDLKITETLIGSGY